MAATASSAMDVDASGAASPSAGTFTNVAAETTVHTIDTLVVAMQRLYTELNEVKERLNAEFVTTAQHEAATNSVTDLLTATIAKLATASKE